MHFSRLLIGLGLTAAASAAFEPGKEMAPPTEGYYIFPTPPSGTYGQGYYPYGYPKAGLIPSLTSAVFATATTGTDGSIRPIVVVPSTSTGYTTGRPTIANSTSSTGASSASLTTTTGSASPTGSMGGNGGASTSTNASNPKPTSTRPVSSGAGASNASALSVLAVLGLVFLVL